MPSSTWQTLPFSALTLPPLPLSTTFALSSYTIHLPDTANLWTESLDRKAIFMRGWDENTSIDPSDTAENMARLLDCLRCALDASRPGHHKTSIVLAASEQGDDGLTLEVTCPLPGFNALKWPIHLKKQPHSAITTSLVLPLIQAHHSRKRELDSLVSSLKHKDDVIAKLLDKLESTGTGLEHVFTSLSGRKKTSRPAAEEKVKGLAPFNHTRWKSSLEDDDDGPNTVSDLVDEVFGGQGLQCRSTVEADQAPELDSWWRDFKRTSSQLALRSNSNRATGLPRTPSPPAVSKDADDDDFQVQATPPRLASSHKRTAARAKADDDASTADEEDGAEQKPNIAAVAKPAAKPSAPRFGTIGGKPQPAAASPTGPAAKSPPSRKDIPAEDSETASEADDDDDATASVPDSSPPRRPPPSSAPKRGVIGQIGGKGPTPPQEDNPNTAHEQQDSAPAPKRMGVIGKIGGPPAPSPAPNDEPLTRGRQKTTRAEEPAVRETSGERADRKREELKKELERKAAAGPAKKKRKF